jgi:hypothetical protein
MASEHVHVPAPASDWTTPASDWPITAAPEVARNPVDEDLIVVAP